jgi:hypothetical protein
MPTFIVQFFTPADWAELNITARSPLAALKRARRLVDEDLCALDFASYDGIEPVEHIEVCDESGRPVADWKHANLRLRLAAPGLLEAAKLVIARWECGDLADAVRQLAAAVDEVGAA